MSFYTPEASLLVYRIAVLAPNAKELANVFESWAFEVESELKPNTPPQLRVASNFSKDNHGAQAWLSATLGARGRLGVRITMIGYHAEATLPSNELLKNLDAVWLCADLESPSTQEFLKIGSSVHPIEVPTFVIFSKHSDSFLEKAIQLWARRHIQPSKIHFGYENSLRKGLEWALSFS